MRLSTNKITLTLATLLLLSTFSKAQIKLPKLISDGMVLQRGNSTRIWGWASPNEKIIIRFMDIQHSLKANPQGQWQLILKDLKAGGPYSMTLEASNTITINNILIGDVWLCSGQSNMELPMRRVSPLYPDEIKNANNKFIRYFEVPDIYNFQSAQKDLEKGNWVDVSPQTINNISAVAYFFAKKLYHEYKIPIGLINSSLGGSPAQAWISEKSLKKFPEYYKEHLLFQKDGYIDSIKQSDRTRNNNWYKESTQKDLGLKGGAKNWKASGINTSDWENMSIPGFWKDEKIGNVNGVVWFRKEVNIPAEYLQENNAMIIMGRIIDADSIFINGKLVGTTSYQYPPRRYNIPDGILVPGKNTIAIRVISNIGSGGFARGKQYQLVLGKHTIDLQGAWKYKLGVQMEALQPQTFIRWKPGGLYNAMIAPLAPYTIKGALWYQGEANTWLPKEYQPLMTALIDDWRKSWGQDNFPFLVVQLPNFMKAKDQPTESNWAMLREQQLQTLSNPNTALAVTIDVGEWNDIHPLNKQTVGDRLALAAQKLAYGDNQVVYSGPVYQSMQVKKNKIILTFDHIGSGLTTKGNGALKEFAIAGSDHQFVWAKAQIKGNQVIVWSNKIKKPVAVRYAWADNPSNANLYNKEGLPATPFRTDSW